MTTCILGIDPGLTGAVAFYFPSEPHLIGCDDMPVAGGEVDVPTLVRRINTMAPTIAIIEQVHAMPINGKLALFKLGQAYGTVRGIVQALEIPLHVVTPARWKKHFGLNADKERSRALAIRLWPSSAHFSRKLDHGRAEAALIARYAAETMLERAAA